VEAISSLPGVGSRSALRLALHLLRQPSENVHRFASAIDRLADEVKYCRVCGMISDYDVCPLCADRTRDHSTICVVENVRDVMSIEATGQYRGVYHVLGGIISPINGVGPSDINIASLVSRVRKLTGFSPEACVTEACATEACVTEADVKSGNVSSGQQTEVILALPGDVEGETTSFYIYRQLEGLGCRMSTLARGLGFGDNLEYADSLTLGRSITNRTEFKP